VKLQVTVVCSSAPRLVNEVTLDLSLGATVRVAINESKFAQPFSEIEMDKVLIGIWGRRVSLETKLKNQDRIEIYRLLKVDPKVARRQRFVKQGAKTSGLFSKKRPGAKAGY
jgi:putative ubiquitin-RnfH superfamily antitoxin RatB of RatAB toxin-antitoxin module